MVVGKPHRRDHQDLFSADVEPHAAGGEHPHSATHGFDRRDKAGPPAAARARSCRGPGAALGRANTQRGSPPSSTQQRGVTRSMPAPPRPGRRQDPARTPAHRATRHPREQGQYLVRHPGRPAPASCPIPPIPVRVTTRETHQRIGDPHAFGAPPDERIAGTGRFPGNVSSERSGGNSRAQIGMEHLEQPLRPAQIAQPMLARGRRTRTSRATRRGGALGRGRHDDLPTVRHRHQPPARFTALPE